mgnify:CR=1 FL=1
MRTQESRLRVHEVVDLWKDAQDTVATELVAETMASYVHVFRELQRLSGGADSVEGLVRFFLDR